MTCDLCGEDASPRLLSQRIGEDEKRFCCIGCMNVYVILFESGAVASGQDLRATDLFRRSLAMGLISQRIDGSADSDAVPSGEVCEMLVQVSGMWCSACAWLIEHSLQKQKGVVRAEVSFASDVVKVAYDPVRVAPAGLVRCIERLGYSVSELTGDAERSSVVMRDLLLRFGIAAFFWLNVMTLSAVLYVGYFEPIAASATHVMPWVLLALSLPVILYSAQPILRVAFHALRTFTVRMETLLAIGIVSAFVYSIVETIRGGTHLYFDTATAIVTFVLAGKLIERGAKDDTMRSIARLHRMMPAKARLSPIDHDGRERFVPVASLSAGDSVLVKAGERIPVDGIVLEGSCDADESLLSGESVPIAKRRGSTVVSGSTNLGGVITVQVTRASADSALSRIIALVEQAIHSRSSLERVVDRIARVFVPAVLLLAAGTFTVSWLGGFSDGGGSLLRAIAVLVIACPCALGLATPLAVTAAVGRASREGILVGDARMLERVRTLDTVVFDKTGTLTAGDFALVHATLPRDVLARVARLERSSEHPLGHAIVRGAECTELMPATNVQIHKGKGISGEVDGTIVFAGNRRLLQLWSIDVDAESETQARQWEQQGLTVVFCGRDCRMEGLLALGDRLKPDARDVVRALTERGIRVMIVSGDAEETTARTAKLAGVDEFRAAATPDEKAAFVQMLQLRGLRVGMVGDGINDSPALAQADLGIAFASGTEIAMKSAALVLMGDSLAKVLDAIDLSHRTWRIVRQNLFWAFVYNALGISLAMTGTLNPLLAAGAMLASSACVVWNSRRSARAPRCALSSLDARDDRSALSAASRTRNTTRTDLPAPAFPRAARARVPQAPS